METSKSFQISKRVIDSSSLKKLISSVFAHLKKPTKAYHIIEFSFTAISQDGTHYIFNNAKEIDASDIFETKRIISASIELRDYQRKKFISLDLQHGDSEYRNSFQVRGSEESWVTSTYIQFLELIDSFQPQQMLFIRYRWLLVVLITASFSYLTFVITSSFYFMFLALLILWSPIDIILDRYTKLWPSVEIQVGPIHKQIEKKRRKVLYGTFSLIVIPLLVSLFYDLIKKASIF